VVLFLFLRQWLLFLYLLLYFFEIAENKKVYKEKVSATKSVAALLARAPGSGVRCNGELPLRIL